MRALAADTIPYYAQGHGALLEQARALALLAHLPSRHAAAAEKVIADARTCESLRTKIEALRGKTARLLDERSALENLAAGEPLEGLGDYAAWWNRCQAAKRNWQGMLGDQDTWRPHLDRLGEEAAAIETALDRFAKLRGHDLFDASMKGIEEAAQAARGRGILPFHDDACCKAVDEAKRLAGKHELDEEARQRLQAVLEEQAARAAEWMVVVKLLQAMGRLERRSLQLEIVAEQKEVSRTELSGWAKLQGRIQRFTEDARAALDDGKLQAHWESRPDIRANIEKGLLDWESRLDIRASIDKGLSKAEAEVAHDHSVPIDDFPIKCNKGIVRDDLLRWTEVIQPKSWRSEGSDRAGREEVVQFEGGLVGRTAARKEREDRCTVEVYSRSDDGPLGTRSLSFGTLIGGGCWRTYWDGEAIRSEEVRKQNRELKESREIAWRPGPSMSMTR